MTTGATSTIGNQYRAGSPNGQQWAGLFSYDLTELSDFITANTSEYSSVAIQSVAFKLVSAGGNSAIAAIRLFRTDPFTSTGCTWANYTTATPWTVPYQNIGSSVQYGHTGGGSALTGNLGGTSPTTGNGVGNVLQWTTSTNFVNAVTHALAQTDKKLYLTANVAITTWGGGSDQRLNITFSPATTVDNRPELLVTLAVTTTAAPATWTGADDTSWTKAGNWSPSAVPATDAPIIFNSSSIANLGTVLDQDFVVTSVTVTEPSGAVSIGGANTLTVGAGGFDLSGATRDLTISAPVVLSAAQSWNIGASRTLNANGGVSGASPLTIEGAGKVSLGAAATHTGTTTISSGATLQLGAANVLPNGAGSGNLAVNGTLDLNGFSQSLNALGGSGVVDNTGVDAVTLTIGNNDAGDTFSGILQDTGGTLAVVKTGTGNIALSGANAFSGGFTNNGTGTVYPQRNNALGTGPVVMNGGTLYGTTGSYTHSNALTLNGATLRVGGGNNRSLTWNGAITATGTSGLSADGGTTGITLGSTLDITGATFSSYANGTTNTISGAITGTSGNLNVTGGTLALNGANGYTGATTLSGSGALLLQANGTLADASNITINGAGNLVVRNTVGWVYNGTISGDDTGQINLNTGTNATLAGNISGVANINANSPGTDTTISGAISGPANLTVQNGVDGSGLGAVLRLSGANSYGGATTVVRGSLVLAAANVLPDTTPVSIGNATLDAATFTDTAGTLDVTSTATIHLGTEAALAFADSSAVDWSGGSLNLTGTFIPGSSLKFGSSNSALTDDQLLLIDADGYIGFDLDDNGFLIATEALGFAGWQSANNTAGGLGDDHDNDGVSNGIEFFLGGEADTTGFTALPGVTNTGGTVSVTWTMADGYTGKYGTDFVVETSATLADPWVSETLGGTVEITGNQVKFTFPAGTKNFARLKVTGP